MLIDRFENKPFFTLNISCSGAELIEIEENSNKRSFKTHSSSIDIFKLEEPINLPKQFCIDGFWGWTFFVKRLNNISERLSFSLKVESMSEDYETDVATGEQLIATEIYTKDWVLYLGTEDEESLFSRSKLGLSFPERFSKRFSQVDNFWYEIIDRNDLSISVQIPDLKTGEQIYFHLLSSWKLKPKREDISAWVAINPTLKDIKTVIESLEKSR